MGAFDFPVAVGRHRHLRVNEDRLTILLKAAVLSWLSAADASYDSSPTNGEGGVSCQASDGALRA